MLRRIDTHAHGRDGEKESYKETIAHVLMLAKEQGVGKVFLMPNTKPSITTEVNLLGQMNLVPKKQKDDCFFYFGLTSKERQIAEAVRIFDRYREVIGFKLYASESVGDLAVIEENEQRTVYATLTKLEFEGVVAVHCEEQRLIKKDFFKAEEPFSHTFARPKISEITSVRRQIKLVEDIGFNGTLHICHVSCPESIVYISEAKARGVKVTCEVTPHHIIWDSNMMKRPNGLLYKMNPPLRSRKDVNILLGYLKKGKIDCIGTDHAPHAIGEKLYSPYLSGFPSLYLYRYFVEEFLPRMGVNRKLIDQMTCYNICKIFNLKI